MGLTMFFLLQVKPQRQRYNMRAKPTNLSDEELKSLFDNAQKERDYIICGYTSVRGNGTYSVCCNAAGKNTSHPGEGNCSFHGGCGRPIVTGNGAVYKPKVKTLLETAKEYKNQQLKDHLETVNILHALRTELARGISIEHISLLPPERIEVIRRLLETVSKIDEVQLKRQERDLKTPEDVMVLVTKILEIVEKEVKDVDATRRIFSKIKEVCV